MNLDEQAREEQKQRCQQVWQFAQETGVHLIEWFGSQSCPNCSQINEISDQFCGQCGAKLSGGENDGRTL